MAFSSMKSVLIKLHCCQCPRILSSGHVSEANSRGPLFQTDSGVHMYSGSNVCYLLFASLDDKTLLLKLDPIIEGRQNANDRVTSLQFH